VADHGEVDLERLVVVETAFVSQLRQARLERAVENAGRAAVDEDEARSRVGAEVEQQAVAELGAQGFEGERATSFV